MLRGEKRPGLLPCWRTDAEPIRRPPPLFLTSEATGPRDCGGAIQASWTPAAGDSEAGDGGSVVPQAALLQPQLRFSSGAGHHLVVTLGLTSEAGPILSTQLKAVRTFEFRPMGKLRLTGGQELWAPRGGRAPDTGPVPNFSLVVLRAPGRVARLKWLRAHGDPGPARRDSSHSWALQPLPVGPVCLPWPSQDPTLLSPTPFSEPTVG